MPGPVRGAPLPAWYRRLLRGNVERPQPQPPPSSPPPPSAELSSPAAPRAVLSVAPIRLGLAAGLSAASGPGTRSGPNSHHLNFPCKSHGPSRRRSKGKRFPSLFLFPFPCFPSRLPPGPSRGSRSPSSIPRAPAPCPFLAEVRLFVPPAGHGRAPPAGSARGEVMA